MPARKPRTEILVAVLGAFQGGKGDPAMIGTVVMLLAAALGQAGPPTVTEVLQAAAEESKAVSKAAPEFDFRQTKWGMSKEQVIATEGKPASDEPEKLLYETKVTGLKAAMTFDFCDGKLARAGYALMEKYAE